MTTARIWKKELTPEEAYKKAERAKVLARVRKHRAKKKAAEA